MPSCSMVSPILGRSNIAASVGPMAVNVPSAATPQSFNHPGARPSPTRASSASRPAVAIAGSQLPTRGCSVHSTAS